MRVEVVAIAALVLLTAGLGIAAIFIARSIRREHEARFKRIERRLEMDATELVDRLLRRD